nr:MAG TPA: cellulase [Herelleviridae sp.]
MDYSFATSQEAATVAGITPADIGVPANNYVRKKELVATGKFDEAGLASYTDNEFVLLKDIAQGSVTISLAMASDIVSRGTVQINNGTAGATASLSVDVGDQIVAKCNLSSSNDKFDGWYNGNTKVSSDMNYSFTATANISLTAKAFYLDVTPTSLDFVAGGETKTLTVTTNTNWTVS